MIDRNEVLEAALDSMPEGVALLGTEGEVIFWNQAAQGITGYAAIDVLAQTLPKNLEPLLVEEIRNEVVPCGKTLPENRWALVRARHKLGHGVPVMKRVLVLRNELGERIGAAALFHPAESVDALPQGENGADKGMEECRANFAERLQMELDDFARGGPTFGVLWIGVDQAGELRKTHGAGACNAMLEKVRHALAQGLRPTEEMGRWCEDEFLILAHERNAEMLAIHAQTLTGLARTADFRWWGDRISLTVSVGAAQAGGNPAETLAQLLKRARQAMQMSVRAGGNRAMVAATVSAMEDSACSPS